MQPSLLLVCSNKKSPGSTRAWREGEMWCGAAPLLVVSSHRTSVEPRSTNQWVSVAARAWLPTLKNHCISHSWGRKRRKQRDPLFECSKVFWDVITGIGPVFLWRWPRCDGPALCQTEHLRSHLRHFTLLKCAASVFLPPLWLCLPRFTAAALFFFFFTPLFLAPFLCHNCNMEMEPAQLYRFN